MGRTQNLSQAYFAVANISHAVGDPNLHQSLQGTHQHPLERRWKRSAQDIRLTVGDKDLFSTARSASRSETSELGHLNAQSRNKITICLESHTE